MYRPCSGAPTTTVSRLQRPRPAAHRRFLLGSRSLHPRVSSGPASRSRHQPPPAIRRTNLTRLNPDVRWPQSTDRLIDRTVRSFPDCQLRDARRSRTDEPEYHRRRAVPGQRVSRRAASVACRTVTGPPDIARSSVYRIKRGASLSIHSALGDRSSQPCDDGA